MRNAAATWYAAIWIGGNHADAIRACREWCRSVPLCVTVTPTSYVYTGGVEEGVCVRLINYPRFPASVTDLEIKAERLAEFLMVYLCQDSYSIEYQQETVWVSHRDRT
jgi:hypothetical protein